MAAPGRFPAICAVGLGLSHDGSALLHVLRKCTSRYKQSPSARARLELILHTGRPNLLRARAVPLADISGPPSLSAAKP